MERPERGQPRRLSLRGGLQIYTEGMPIRDSTQRFSSRVADYVLYRPGYPREVLELLKDECGLGPNSTVADIASGTGLFTQLLLESGGLVYGVEPNAEMRRAGEEYLAAYPRFVSLEGSAEATKLPDRSVDIVTAAQAAHWFDLAKTRCEFLRILRPGGWCALLWNDRDLGSTAFLRGYEQLLRDYGTDYEDVRRTHLTAEIDVFFAPSPHRERVFEMKQELDYAGLEGRLLSSSYIPQLGHPKYVPMLQALRRLFDEQQQDGRVVMPYNTRVYFGRLE
jgi:SAM-dependent methyltransferase